jgi:hypothetical protein
VVHGIPGRDVAPSLNPLLPVDVKVNGSVCLLQGLTFGSISGPYTVPAGPYKVQVSLANTLAPCSNAPVISANVRLTAGNETAVVAALSPKGVPVAYAFPLDLSPITPGSGRVFVANAAETAPVGLVGVIQPPQGNPPPQFFIAGLAAGKSASLSPQNAGTYQVNISSSSTGASVFGPFNLTVPNDGVALAFIVGNAANPSITVLTTVIPDTL